jgi:light-regulated signal transduction histidine kinase (bacteriophytochrome)
MFQDLRTGTKLLILCSLFIVTIGVTTFALVAEKKIAINFARKELIGNQYLAILRNVYAAILASRRIDRTAAQPGAPTDELIQALTSADIAAAGALQTANLEQALVAKLREFQSHRDPDARTGIVPSDAERIFDAFFTTKSDGMGMGLAICRSIVEAHSGHLWVSSSVLHGSIFHVELPSGRPG